MILRNRLALSLLLVCGVLASACDTGDDSTNAASAAPDDQVSSTVPRSTGPSVPFDERTAQAKQVPNRTDLVDEHPATPIAVAVDAANPRAVRVRFWGGVAPCHGAHAEAHETDATVDVSLFTGTPPEGRDKMCIELAELQEVTVELTRPAGTRALRAVT